MRKLKDSMAINRKNSVSKEDSNEKCKVIKRRISATIIYLVLNSFLFVILCYTILYKQTLSLQIVIILLFCFGIISFFIVSFSDPGYLVDELKQTLDENTIKSLEERSKSHEESIIEECEFRDSPSSNRERKPKKDENEKVNKKESYKRQIFNTEENMHSNTLFQKKSNDRNIGIKVDKEICISVEKSSPVKQQFFSCKNDKNLKINFVNYFNTDADYENNVKYRRVNENSITRINRYADHDTLELSKINEIDIASNNNSHVHYRHSRNESTSSLKDKEAQAQYPSDKEKEVYTKSGFHSDRNNVIDLEKSNNLIKELRKAKTNDIVDIKGINIEIEDMIAAHNDNHIDNDKKYHNPEFQSVTKDNINLNLEHQHYIDKFAFNNNDESILENAYCMKCLIEPPLRAKHCKTCDKCVATFDHHCSYIANCIGEKNKKTFIIFLFIHSVELCFFLLLNLLNFEKESNASDWMRANYLIFINTFLGSLVFSFVLSLLVFQIQMVLVNQSTWENYSWHKINYMVKLSRSQKSPFNRGFTNNVSFVCCFKRHQSQEDNAIKGHIDWNKLLKN